jgi:hypothetical protein
LVRVEKQKPRLNNVCQINTTRMKWETLLTYGS